MRRLARMCLRSVADGDDLSDATRVHGLVRLYSTESHRSRQLRAVGAAGCRRRGAYASRSLTRYADYLLRHPVLDDQRRHTDEVAIGREQGQVVAQRGHGDQRIHSLYLPALPS